MGCVGNLVWQITRSIVVPITSATSAARSNDFVAEVGWSLKRGNRIRFFSSIAKSDSCAVATE